MTYVHRTLVASKGAREERSITELEVISLSKVVVLLGEPGIGKTELTKYLEASFGATRVAAGTFWRSANPAAFQIGGGDTPLIIDGLDEISAPGAESPIDRILQSLSKLNNPSVIISCRSADWLGSVSRHKLSQDYGVEPILVHIIPFSDEQVRDFLGGYNPSIDCSDFLAAIKSRGLDDLAGNPLTLKLLAEVWIQDAGLPTSKTDLLERATHVLVEEENQAHDQSPHAQISREALLDAAGAIFAHLILSGSVGIATGSRKSSPVGFVPFAELGGMGHGEEVQAVLKTRLFKSEAEGQLVPVHRVIAEYHAARWLSKRLDTKLSQRRLFRLIEFAGGVPSALRGLHAWIGYFFPQVFSRCADADPYGFLRYGDISRLSAANARHLLRALSKLAEEDPYFRSEDWGVRAVAGLGRSELKQDIVELITSPQRHMQLSALILGSLAGSALTSELVPELLALIEDKSAPYVERIHAAEALAKSGVSVDWLWMMEMLLGQRRLDSNRLVVELIAIVGPSNFGPAIIADALVALNGMNESERRESRIFGSDYRLFELTPPDLARQVLDCIAKRVIEKQRPRHWHPGRSMTSAIQRLLLSAIDGAEIDPRRFWSWVEYLEGRTGYHEDATATIKVYLQARDDFRRGVQRIVLYDTTIDGAPWMAIVHELPRSVSGLMLSTDDAASFLLEIADEATPTPYQIELWGDLVRAMGRPDRHEQSLKDAISVGVRRHRCLAAIYEEIARPPARDYESEQRRRQVSYNKSRLAKFRRHRESFSKVVEAIAAGQNMGALVSLADGYLGRYSDLVHPTDPVARLTEWVGENVAAAATKGFMVALHRDDLPNFESICSIRLENKRWRAESVMLAGVAEIVRSGGSLRDVSQDVITAVLAIWWGMPEFNSSKLGEDIEVSLEGMTFSDEQRAETFISVIIETQLAAGKSPISGIYRFVREKRFLNFSPRLALKWLANYLDAPYDTQEELVRFAIHSVEYSELLRLVHNRLSTLNDRDKSVQFLWAAVAFCIGPPVLHRQVAATVSKELIWPIIDLVLPDAEGAERLELRVERYEAIINAFAVEWPHVAHPTGGWSGRQNPWDASDFIKYCVRSIGNNATSDATEALDRLQVFLGESSYSEYLQHIAFVQLRTRRDQSYVPPSFRDLKDILGNAKPTSVQDLQAVILDHLDDLQLYVRNSDTGGWEAFWDREIPKVENTCRDRLLDLLRPRLSSAVELFPELPMPDQNRVDIYATILGQGLPIEIKGQWHPQVWNASSIQLSEKYTRDWRTDGRGIYLVLWFGQVAGKNLPGRQDDIPLPSNAAELQKMLIDGLDQDEKLRIDVFVLDVSKSPTAHARLARKRGGSNRSA
ncbi:NACHT domain-containing protein [Ensifer sp. 2TAB8]|uniref:NACHT domain-containing protein n=1 Tax=Ensifer sp. 2TAB8 TaxID=3233006 RepID=UPI003F903B30